MNFAKLATLCLAIALAASTGCKDSGGDAPAPVPDVPPVPAVAPVLVPGTATLRGVVDRSAGQSLSVCGHSTTVADDGSWSQTVPIAETVGCVIALRSGAVTVWSGVAEVSIAQP